MENFSHVTSIFDNFRECLESEQIIREEIRKVVRELDVKVRETLTILQRIHHSESVQKFDWVCLMVERIYPDIREKYEELDKLVPANQFYRFHDHWRMSTQRICYVIALVNYLKSNSLINIEEVSNILFVKEKTYSLHLELDDYLMGLLQMASELSRLAVNAVTSGDFIRPLEISKFVNDLDSGFRLLNLKNDSLRKRYDGLKYDLKEIEKVVYDVTIRQLHKESDIKTITQ